MDDIYIAKIAFTADLQQKMQQNYPIAQMHSIQIQENPRASNVYNAQYGQTKLMDTNGNELSYSLGYSESDLNTTLGLIVGQPRLSKIEQNHQIDQQTSNGFTAGITRPRNLSFGNNGSRGTRDSQRSKYLNKRATQENSSREINENSEQAETNHYWSRSRQHQKPIASNQQLPQPGRRPQKVMPDNDKLGSENVSSDECDEIEVFNTSSSRKNLHSGDSGFKDKRDSYRTVDRTQNNNSFLKLHHATNPTDLFMNQETVPNTISQRYQEQSLPDHSKSAKNLLNQNQLSKRLHFDKDQPILLQTESNIYQQQQKNRQYFQDNCDEDEIERFNNSIMQNFKAYEEPPSQRMMKTEYNQSSVQNNQALNHFYLHDQSSSLISNPSQNSVIEREISNSSRNNITHNIDQNYNTLQDRIIQKVLDTDIKTNSITRKIDQTHEYSSNDQLNLSTFRQNSYKILNRGDNYIREPSNKKDYLDRKFEDLYRDNQIKAQKLKRIQELKEMQKKFQEEQECTFSPKITRNDLISPRNGVDSSKKMNDLKKVRSPQKFFEDMLTFQQQRDLKVNTMRQLVDLNIKNEGGKRNNLMNQKSRAELFERLHQEELKKLKLNNNFSPSSQIQKENSSSRTRDEIINHLYTDYFIRDTKLKSLQNQVYTQEQMINQESINLQRSNQVLANKIQTQVKQAYVEMGLDQNDELSFFNILELMTKCGYIDTFDEELRTQLNSMWMNLIKDLSLNTEATVTQRNLLIFLMAVDNIFLDVMKSYPCGNHEKRQFGYFLNEYFYVQTESEAKKIHIYYQRLYLNRQKRLEDARKQAFNQQIISSPSQKECVFSPQINHKSKQIADENIIKLEQAIKQGTGDDSVKIKVEDLLLSKGQVIQEKLRQQREIYEKEKDSQYTFSPRLITTKANQSYLRMNTNSNSQRRKSSYGGNNASILKSRNVFDKLYAKAQTQHKQKVQEKTTYEIVEEQEFEKCTFKPNLNRTQKINQQVQSIIKKSNQNSQRKNNFQNYRGNMTRLVNQKSPRLNYTYSSENITNLCINNESALQKQQSFVRYLQQDNLHQNSDENNENSKVYYKGSVVQPFTEQYSNYDSKQNSLIQNNIQTPNKNFSKNRVQFAVNSTQNEKFDSAKNSQQNLYLRDENNYVTQNSNSTTSFKQNQNQKKNQHQSFLNPKGIINISSYKSTQVLNDSNIQNTDSFIGKDLTSKQVKQYLKTVIQSSL